MGLLSMLAVWEDLASDPGWLGGGCHRRYAMHYAPAGGVEAVVLLHGTHALTGSHARRAAALDEPARGPPDRLSR